MSKRRIDDLSILLTRKKLLGVDIEYDDTFGYFKSTNFSSIYDPEQGGDYLEFKRIECGGQQCFPFGPEQTAEIIVENTSTSPGYWQENPPTIETIVTPGSTERFTQDIRRVPIFTFWSGILKSSNTTGAFNSVILKSTFVKKFTNASFKS